MIRSRVLVAAALAAAPLCSPAAAQTPVRRDSAFDLSVRNIMRGEALVGRSPDEVRWTEDSRTVFFRWRDPEARDTTTHLYRVSVDDRAPRLVADSVADRMAPAIGGDWSADRSRRASERGGDIFVADARGNERRITDTPARERSPHLAADGRTVYFISGNNVYAAGVDGGTLRQLTDLRLEDAPRTPEPRGQRKELLDDQTELLDVIRDRVAEREHRARADSLRTRVRPAYLGKDATLGSAEVSPSGRYLLFSVGGRADGPRATIVPNYITESGFTEDIPSRTKVGDAQAGGRVGMLELATGRITWIEGDKGRTPTFGVLGWAPRADRALLLAVSSDYEDRWMYVAGPDGRTVLVEQLHDEAWVGGPAFFSGGWIGDDRVWFISEKTGYSHLYAAPAAGGAHLRQLGSHRRSAVGRWAALLHHHQRDSSRRAEPVLRSRGGRSAGPPHLDAGVDGNPRVAGRPLGRAPELHLHHAAGAVPGASGAGRRAAPHHQQHHRR
ncbi:MAG TPA: hypothetical protein VE913_05855, partial [Longimicrobium sp.]|nr:hypothetical protein [Longimicrobium sp.]